MISLMGGHKTKAANEQTSWLPCTDDRAVVPEGEGPRGQVQVTGRPDFQR